MRHKRSKSNCRLARASRRPPLRQLNDLGEAEPNVLLELLAHAGVVLRFNRRAGVVEGTIDHSQKSVGIISGASFL